MVGEEEDLNPLYRKSLEYMPSLPMWLRTTLLKSDTRNKLLLWAGMPFGGVFFCLFVCFNKGILMLTHQNLYIN